MKATDTSLLLYLVNKTALNAVGEKMLTCGYLIVHVEMSQISVI
jgi:hypothetical protein